MKPGPNVDIVHDITQGIPLHDNHATRLRSCHCLEHLPFRSVEPLLKECYRVLRSGGSFWIEVPDLDFFFERIREEGLIATSEPNPLAWMDALWGQQKDESDFHRSGFTFNYLSSLLEGVGFVLIRHKGWDNPWEFKVRCFKP